MFEKIFAAITNVRKAPIGGTGYLDLMPWSDPVKGEDCFGRPYFVLPLKVIASNRHGRGMGHHFSYGEGMICFFQRFTNDPTLWHSVGSHVAGNPISPVMDGQIRNPDNGDLETKLLEILAGKEVTFVFEKDWKGECRYERKAMLLMPIEVATWKLREPDLSVDLPNVGPGMKYQVSK